MSRIYFHSPLGEVEVRGSERAHMGVITDSFAKGLLDVRGYDREKWAPLIDPHHYIHRSGGDPEWAAAFNLAWGGITDLDLKIAGQNVNSWHLTLNTVVAAGSDPMILFARIHATCEIHGYVLGEHRDWIASIIEQGLRIGLYRPTQGWDEVIEFLRGESENPVVMSYSVCDWFPNPHIAGFERDEQDDFPDYYNLPEREQWDKAFQGLVAQNNGIDLNPESFRTRQFGLYNLTVFDVVNHVYGWKVLDTLEPSV
jgi:hypothetical protein